MEATRTGSTLLLFALTVGGCTGQLDKGGSARAEADPRPREGANPPLMSGTDTKSSPNASAAAGPCARPAVETSPVRRLTRWELNNTLADLLGDRTAPASSFLPESLQLGFTNGAASPPLSATVVEDFERVAGEVAARASRDLPRLLGCDPMGAGEAACVERFVRGFGRRAFRRPLADDEVRRYTDAIAIWTAELGLGKAVELTVAALLQSPSFLYRIEDGVAEAGAPGVLRVGPFALASRLSYLLWGSMPSDDLLDAAERGELATAAGVKRWAERLLADDRGAAGLSDFYVQWARLDDVPALHKDDKAFAPEIGALQQREAAAFVDGVVRKGPGTLAAFLTEPATFLDATLARFYGLPAPAGSGFARVERDPTRYAGFLSLGAVMAKLAHEAQPSAVHRGTFVLEQVMCSPPPPPPCDVNLQLPSPDPRQTQRRQLEMLTSTGTCAGCHALINPPGFAFERFDAIGRWRETDRGLPIDSSGTLLGAGDATGPFTDNVSLAKILAGSKHVRRCAVESWFHYGYGRGQGAADACTVEQLATAFETSGGDLRRLLVELTQTPAFLYLAAEAPPAISQGGAP